MPIPWPQRGFVTSRSGFSIIEAVMVLLVVLVVVGTLTPRLASILSHSRINRAAGIVASDFYLAQSLASRAREPVKITVSSAAKTVRLSLYSNDSTLVTRYYGTEGEWKVGSLSASPATTLVLPSGMTSASITVSLTYEDYTRQVKLSRAGQIRIIR